MPCLTLKFFSLTAALVDFTLSNGSGFYLSMGNALGVKGLSLSLIFWQFCNFYNIFSQDPACFKNVRGFCTFSGYCFLAFHLFVLLFYSF